MKVTMATFSQSFVFLEPRLKQSRMRKDLEEAIRCTEQAVEPLMGDRPSLVERLERLITPLEAHFDRTGTVDDLEEVVRRNEQARRPHLWRLRVVKARLI